MKRRGETGRGNHAPGGVLATMKIRTLLMLLLAVGALVLIGAACGGDDEEGGGDTTATETGEAGGDLSGRIEADGSSTVGPLTTAAAERFQDANSDVQVTVGISGTGGGFERFCAGETDLSNASRQIDEDEVKLCENEGVEYSEIRVATDALTVVVSGENDWATCLTVAQLKKIWGPGSKVSNWNQVAPEFPDEDLKLFGPGTDSGTFDYFTGEINGEEGASRSDYQASEDDNVIVQGIQGETGGLGYLGFSYFEENQETLKALGVDGGSGCVAPSVETAQDNSYTPLSRPLFVYVNNESLQRPEVKAFLEYMLDNATEITKAAQFVPLTGEQLTQARETLTQAEAGT
jgi:phosphate transport system substrate-binding protein